MGQGVLSLPTPGSEEVLGQAPACRGLDGTWRGLPGARRGELRELEREMGTTSESRAGGELPRGPRQGLRSRLAAAVRSVQLWGRLEQSCKGCPPGTPLRKRGGEPSRDGWGRAFVPHMPAKGRLSLASALPGAWQLVLGQSGCGAPRAEEQGPGGTHVPSSGAARTRCSSACCRKAFLAPA